MSVNTFQLTQGNCPILISMPHIGTQLPESLAGRITPSAKRLADTDWYLDRLYQFALNSGCYVIRPYFSRYVIDLNRPEDDQNLYPGQNTTQLCPTNQFDHQPIYCLGEEPSEAEIKQRIALYWQPYHQQLSSSIAQIKEDFSKVLLFEAHSIKSFVPRFFSGQLADFNFGDYNGASCSPLLVDALTNWPIKGYTKVINGRFKGGYITRAYACPQDNIHALQLELSQATYMDEEKLQFEQNKADRLSEQLQLMFDLFRQFLDRI